MTQMQSPYQEQSNVKLYQEPDRTSIMAILSMVFGVGGCCLGITSIPAILLGVIGLIGISKSKGRVGGSGFAIAGILIGLLTFALWMGLIFGGGGMFNKMMGEFAGNTEQIFLDLQADNFDAARVSLGSPISGASDEELIAFREGYRSSLGDLVSKTDGFGDLISGYVSVGPMIQPYQSIPGHVPVPMIFDSGYGLVIYVIDPQQRNQGMIPTPNELIVVDMQGVEYRLTLTGAAEVPEIPEIEIPTAEPAEEPEPSSDSADDQP